ncbi:MAG: HAD-IIB family hydrolase [Deltaproteobacteria bacterium]
MQSFEALPAADIRAVFCDIDDTLTTDGRLPAVAYEAVEKLAGAGIPVVPVTGRPAGWCDMIARFWPVAGVVGENGAFYFSYDRSARRLHQAFVLSAEERATLQARLAEVKAQILAAVPGAGVASDQPYRIHDLAIDFCEDVEPLERADVDRIVEIFEAAGATAKVSSIHVNGWFGTYDKLGMIRRIAREVLDLDLDRPEVRQRAVYVGDSPNDEPAFGFFEHSVGVANIRAFTDRLTSPPAYVTQREGGEGFAELTCHLLHDRALR